MFQSLPLIEQDRFWLKYRNTLDKRKKRKIEKNFLDFSEKENVAGSSVLPNMEKSVYNYRRNEV